MAVTRNVSWRRRSRKLADLPCPASCLKGRPAARSRRCRPIDRQRELNVFAQERGRAHRIACQRRLHQPRVVGKGQRFFEQRQRRRIVFGFTPRITIWRKQKRLMVPPQLFGNLPLKGFQPA